MLDVVIEYAINGILCVFFQPICSSLCFCFFPPFPLLLSRYKSSLICCVSLGTSLSVSGPALSIWRECISKATGAPPLPPPLLSWPSCPTLYPQPHFTGQFPLIRDALSLFPQKMENCRFIKISLTSIPPVALRGSGLSQKKPPPSKPGSRSAGAGGGVEFWFAGSRQYSGPNPQPWQPSPLGGQGRREGSSAL